jgi:biopolymer transport protein ExbD
MMPRRRNLCAIKYVLMFFICAATLITFNKIRVNLNIVKTQVTTQTQDVYYQVVFNPKKFPIIKKCHQGSRCELIYYFGYQHPNQVFNITRYLTVVTRFDPSIYYDLQQHSVPATCETIHKYGILPCRLVYPGNLGHFFNEHLGFISSYIAEIRQIHKTNEQVAVFFPPVRSYERLAKFQPIFSALGARLLFIQNSTEPSCIENLYVIKSRDYIPLSKDAILQISQNINATCANNKQVTILQRAKTRHLANINEVVNYFTSHGINNVQIVQFETLNIFEQLSTVMCSNVFIGVHGAGLGWFHFLPQDGVFVEIGPNGWRKSFYSKLTQKIIPYRNIRTYNYVCDIIVSEEDKKDKSLMSDVRKGSFTNLDSKFHKMNCTIDVSQFKNLISDLKRNDFHT